MTDQSLSVLKWKANRLAQLRGHDLYVIRTRDERMLIVDEMAKEELYPSAKVLYVGWSNPPAQPEAANG